MLANNNTKTSEQQHRVQWHHGLKNLQFSDRQLQICNTEDYRMCLKIQFCLQTSPKWSFSPKLCFLDKHSQTNIFGQKRNFPIALNYGGQYATAMTPLSERTWQESADSQTAQNS